ncbi:TetR family transcriptional regulator [Staphylococcus schleiferi subsp. coagulans]|uniref:TetR/AcrR family transcriptional regulator n=1 Tax=Staphylococcus coagulans TaxID=74706 RepID=UPI0015FC6017|nr:TetR/AcrR family transcriptional regulator [Staphylococcus coagulans]MBA8760219.1 TetR family transcriptional regulator [Staphylococcus coagulans]MBA8768950.1 TetR family transcriptional regulator [Staphylococcus coagulans]
MNEKDIRVQKTNLRLSQIFLELLEEQLLTKITINHICHKANVHRTTFYQHFKDKYELLWYVCRGVMKPYFNLQFEERLYYPFSSLEKAFDQQIIKILQTQKEDPKFYRLILKQFSKYFEGELKSHETKLPFEPHFPVEVFGYVYTSTIQSMNQWRIDCNIAFDAYYMDKLYQKLISFKHE